MTGCRKRSVYSIILFLAAAFAMLLLSVRTYADDPAGSETPQFTDYVESDYGYQYTGSEEVVTIPSGITNLNAYMFYQNSTVLAVIVPGTVEFVSDYAFYQCSSLRYVCFLSAETRAKDHFLYKTPSLINISAPKSSEIYQNCVKDRIPVTASKAPCFERKTVYLLPRDRVLMPLYNSLGATYATGDKKIVAINKKTGMIRGKRRGTTIITATSGGKQYSYKVVVLNKTESERVKQVRKTEKLGSKKTNTLSKIRAAHDWMIRNVSYDYDAHIKGKIPGVAHTSRGSLIRKLCVCDGYAYGFLKLMQSIHVPCKVVRGTANGAHHAWNMVKLNGKWYHVDVTWDDPIIGESNANTIPRYDYFLKSTSYMKKHDHSFNTKKYPKCSSKKYDKKGLTRYRNMLDQLVNAW